MVRMIVAGVSSWALGFLAYEAWLRLVWHQSMGGEWRAVAFWSAAAFVIVGPIAYLPVMMCVRKALGGYQPIGWFPLAGSMLGVLPTALVVFFAGGRFRDLLSPEASVFFVMFAIVGVVFGFAYAWNRGSTA